MFFRQALIGMMQLFAVFAFFAAGFVFVCLPFLDHLRFQLAHILLEDTHLLVWIGAGFFAFTFVLIMGFYGLSKGRFLLLRMGDLVAEIDATVLKKTIPPVLLKQFSARVRLIDLEVFKNRQLRIGLFVSPMEEKEKEKILLEAERCLQTLLSERFGYRHSFLVQSRDSLY